MDTNRNLRVLTESALCVALATILSLITLFHMPLGGSVTAFSTLPVIIVSLRHGTKWGIGSALVFSLTQLLLGMANVTAVPVKNLESMILCALLDYVLAYTVLGFTGVIARSIDKRGLGLSVAILATGCGRLACSFFSGIVIWGSFTPDGWSVELYSLAYNAAWCLPDTLIALAACLLLARVRMFGLLPTEKTTVMN